MESSFKILTFHRNITPIEQVYHPPAYSFDNEDLVAAVQRYSITV